MTLLFAPPHVQSYEKVLSKLHLKHDKIVDIQKALHSADLNNDKQLDFDEWRHDLKLYVINFTFFSVSNMCSFLRRLTCLI